MTSVGVSACFVSQADKHPQVSSPSSTPCTLKVTNNLVFRSDHMTQTCPIPRPGPIRVLPWNLCPHRRAKTLSSCSVRGCDLTAACGHVLFQVKGRKNKTMAITTGREKAQQRSRSCSVVSLASRGPVPGESNCQTLASLW